MTPVWQGAVSAMEASNSTVRKNSVVADMRRTLQNTSVKLGLTYPENELYLPLV